MLDIEQLKKEMDEWVKDFQGRISNLEKCNDIAHKVAEEHNANIDHNYELIHELNDKINRVEQEVQALRLVQLISLQQQAKEGNKWEKSCQTGMPAPVAQSGMTSTDAGLTNRNTAEEMKNPKMTKT